MLQLNLEGRVDGKWTSNEFMFRPGKSPVHVGYGLETDSTEVGDLYLSHKLRFLLDIGSLKSNSDSTGGKVANALIPDSISSKIHLKSTDMNKNHYFNEFADQYNEIQEHLKEHPDDQEARSILNFLDAFKAGPRHMSTEVHWDLNNSIKRHISSGARHFIPSGITLKHDNIGRINGIGDSSSYLKSRMYAGTAEDINRTNVGTSVKVTFDIPLGRSR